MKDFDKFFFCFFIGINKCLKCFKDEIIGKVLLFEMCYFFIILIMR